MENSQDKRDDYLNKIKDVDKENIVYIDESGIDHDISKEYGWCRKGEQLHAKKSGKYYKRTNVIAGIVNKQIIAPLVFYGSCNTELFTAWVEQFLIKEL